MALFHSAFGPDTDIDPTSLRKRGVERATLKFKDYHPDWEFDMDLA